MDFWAPLQRLLVHGALILRSAKHGGILISPAYHLVLKELDFVVNFPPDLRALETKILRVQRAFVPCCSFWLNRAKAVLKQRRRVARKLRKSHSSSRLNRCERERGGGSVFSILAKRIFLAHHLAVLQQDMLCSQHNRFGMW